MTAGMMLLPPLCFACKLTLLRWLPVIFLFLYVSLASATGNFLPIRLANGVTVELPRNWVVLSDNQLVTLDSYVEAIRTMAGASDPSSDLNFAANYYDEQGKTAAIFNIRYYPNQKVTQVDSRLATAADTKEIDDALRTEMSTAMKQFGIRILSWLGTKKQSINGLTAFVTEYRRAAMREGAPFRVRLVRVLSAERSFTVTVSYREDQELFLRPICDRVIWSVRVAA